MQHINAIGRTLRRIGTALPLAALIGCQDAPDLATVQAEQARTLHRYDTFLAAASNGTVMVAGTSAGTIVASSDGGSSWHRQQLQRAASIVSMATCPDGSFAALDFYRRVWLSDAAGRSWTPRDIKTSDNVTAITCSAGKRLWVVGSRTRILSSADLGMTWTAQQAGDDAILTTVQFLDERHGHITGEFGIHLATQDGGATWVRQPKLPGDFYPYATVFKDQDRAWASGVAGVLLHTRDGGRTWDRQVNDSAAAIYGLALLGDTVYGVGFGGQMVALQGETWRRYEHGKTIPAYLVAAATHGAKALVVAGAAGALHVITPAAQPDTTAKQNVAVRTP